MEVEPNAGTSGGFSRLVRRAALFGVGGVLSYTLNALLFDWLTTGVRWPDMAARHMAIEPLILTGVGWPATGAYAVSLGSVIGLAFMWSYHVNFRTSVAWHACAPRYLATVGACAVFNYTIVQLLLLRAPEREKIIILIGMGVAAAGKFVSYHFWVFPGGMPPRETPGESPAD